MLNLCSNASMIKLVIFDFDGTMFHTAPEIHKAINMTLKDLNHHELSYSEVSSSIGHGLLHLLDTVKLDIDLSPQGIQKLVKMFRSHYESIMLDSKPFPGLIEFLNDCPLQVAIASNKDVNYVKTCMEQPPWNKVNWLAIHGGNSFPTKKPEPEIITTIIDKANCLPNETVIVGDGVPDIEVAINTGIHSIAVSYGYSQIDELISLGAEKSIDHLSELIKSINSFNN